MKKSKKPMADSTRVLRSSAAKKRPPESPPPGGGGGEIAAKRIRSEKSKDNGGVPSPRVLPSTKKVSVVRETKVEEEDPRPKKKRGKKRGRGRPPKSSNPPEAPNLAAKKKKNKSEGTSGSGERRSEVKQRISDQIKALLLDAGWTIDLRPRNGRDYLDAVYIPPKPFKGSFWSVTKAYAVYQEHRNSEKSEEKPALTSDPIPGDLLSILTRKTNPGAKRRWKIGADRTPKKRRGCALLARKSNNDYVPYPWKRTVLSWMVDSGVVSVDSKVNYVNKKGKSLMEGWVTRGGIRCGCCSDVVTPSEFEAHAGGSNLLHPFQNIVVEEGGLSLLQCQIDAWEKQTESERKGFWEVDIGDEDPHDDTCGICADGGDLVCCDGCPSTFHLDCLDIETIPPGDWHCKNCACKFCGLISDASSDEDGATISPLLCCSQCEQKFHQGCTPDGNAVSLGPDSVFCGKSCKMVFKKLQKFLGVKNDLEGGFSWTLIRRFDDASGSLSNLPNKAECNSKIAVALAIMDECFLPTIDQRSGIKVIHNVVYHCGTNISRLNFSGFYTFILERGDEIMSAASVRIHGTRLAEMPYIGTRNMYRRQGLCRRLLSGIESALFSLNVEKLIIPAISELTETWTNVFGFKPLEPSDKQEVRSINLLAFPGIDLLQKPILKVDSAELCTVADGAKQGEREIDRDCELVDSAELRTVADGAKQGEREIDRDCELDTANDCSVLSSLGPSDEVTCPS